MKFTMVSSCVGVFFIAIIASCSANLCRNSSSTSDLPALKNEQIAFGKGNDPLDTPQVKCVKLEQETLQFNCTLTTNRELLHNDSSQSCNIIITAEPCTRYLEIDLVYQFSGKKLLLVWHETSGKFGRFYRNLQTIDLENSCKLSDKIVYPRTSFDWRNLEKLIFYDNNFETISEEIPTIRKGHRKVISMTFDSDGNIKIISAIPLGATSVSDNADKNMKDIVLFDRPSDEMEKLIIRRKKIIKDENV